MPPDAVEWQQASGFCFQQKLCWEDSGKLGKHVTVQDFRPISTLGRGNMGTVLLVAMNHINSPFAMKIKKKQAAKKPPSQHTDMEREIMSLLHHPFLPTLHAHFEFEKHSLLVIDFCSGGDLNVLRHRQPEKRFSERATQFYAAEVLVALEHLHNLGIVYRDLKPENILIQESGHIMLTDFDLSVRLNAPDSAGMRRSISLRQPEDVIIQSRKPRQWLSLLECFRMCSTKERPKPNGSLIPPRRGVITPLDSRLTDARAQPAEDIYFVGTEEYVAPEILRGLDHGFAVDWWSFGVFLYELSYGETPFKGRSPKETFCNILENDPELPGSRSPLKDMIQRLLVKEPSRRLGFGSGADEIKCHKFFEGLRWETLEFLCRTPFIPPPFSLSEFEGNRNQNRLLKKENTWYERDPSSSPRGSCGSGNSGEEVSLEEIFTVTHMLSQSNSEEK